MEDIMEKSSKAGIVRSMLEAGDRYRKAEIALSEAYAEADTHELHIALAQEKVREMRENLSVLTQRASYAKAEWEAYRSMLKVLEEETE
jgi:flagellar biosynthesis chaperone FliJ